MADDFRLSIDGFACLSYAMLQVSKILRDLAAENHVYGLAQIASEAATGGPFDKVKGLIESAAASRASARQVEVNTPEHALVAHRKG